ncbi:MULTISPECIES: serine/threonine-protein kinase [unclassified Dyella]|uniref:serine/threonine-protein kinase n=1 Tax=unclassified Dyella TaxID=2634549 RepID=UPI000C85AC44|nr:MULTISPECIES: serine/threonine-protein kinase [unclassified Dyella]MDR3446384.1 serine/threonine-protein kinase [Dyella sp.]PMQ04454.1 Serine/threonine-protein kinase PrkC [Dyella sp. AD56]
MNSAFAERWHEIEPLIDQLFDVPAHERIEWLRKHCNDTTLRALVAQALDNASGVEALERGMEQWLPTLADESADALPTIDGYRVLRFVGAGGMASVFEAERELPGGPQTVALKLLRIDVHDADERRRFLREQRILARLQHPHIAQLLDAGFSPSGTPFLALEFVAGDDLMSHCALRSLSQRERLRLFLDVCSAVDHAHRNLIVHRDLKPNNVLVGADGCVKLVDFGIAKLLTGDGERTRTEARRLTRSYAAPEQLAGDAATTAIDVYALGVLLAELLGDQQPHRNDDAHAKASVFDDEALRRTLGVDLHAMVQEATRADPARRYASAAAFGADIQRYLEGKPLQARTDTLAYRALTFAKRHTLAVSIGIVTATLLAGATVIGLHEARLARQSARDAHAQAVTAFGEAQRADALKTFMEELFDSATHGTESNETAEELLARGRERADRDFSMQPALRAEILALVGDLERRSGHPERAWQPLEEAATLANAQFGATDQRTMHIEYLLAKEADELGRVREATARLQHAIDAFETGPERDSPEAVQALAWLAGLDERIGESAKAITLGEQDVALARRILPSDSEALTEAVLNLGWIFGDAGQPERAEPLLREALARKRNHLGAQHADVADTMTLLTAALTKLGRYGESEQLMRDALTIDASAYTHPNAHTAWHLNDLAAVYMQEGKLDEALAFYTKSIAVDQALKPASVPTEAISISNIAKLRFRQGAYAEAEAGMRDAIARRQRLLGVDYIDNGRGYDRTYLAEMLIACGRFDEARAEADGALAEARHRYRDAHPDTAFALTAKAELLAATGDYEHAVAFGAQAVEIYTALDDERSEKAIRARIVYADALQELGRDREAAVQLDDALSAAHSNVPNTSVLVARIEADLAHVDAALGDKTSAENLRADARVMLANAEAGPNTDRETATHLLAATTDKRR